MSWDSRYRPLREGEIIRKGDECLTDSHLGWQPASHDIGGLAPNHNYTAHRMYRRLTDDASNSDLNSKARTHVQSCECSDGLREGR